VHSHVNHLLALIDICSAHKVKPVLHLICDGRDTPPRSAASFYEVVQKQVEAGLADVGTFGGRYYYMDRDKRWERTAQAYNVMTGNDLFTPVDVLKGLTESYEKDVTDEFIPPMVADGNGFVRDGDCIIFYNFRADRMRQLVRAFAVQGESQFADKKRLDNLSIITLTQYDEDLPVDVIFPPTVLPNPLAQVLSDHQLSQFHIAETEKYAHVTYFFNGGREEPFPLEEHFLIPSPKVATYDLAPEMSADKVTQKVIERLKTNQDNFILINFANPDMVGHSGILEAAMRAVECVDRCAGEVVAAVREKGGTVLVTADHGNAEMMIELITRQPHTYHTTSPVPFIVITDEPMKLRPRGILADIAPTILDLLKISPPADFTGGSLLLTDGQEGTGY
jgi:2,3-bisphosphoglycerate-independent phosphoglycerate mutase